MVNHVLNTFKHRVFFIKNRILWQIMNHHIGCLNYLSFIRDFKTSSNNFLSVYECVMFSNDRMFIVFLFLWIDFLNLSLLLYFLVLFLTLLFNLAFYYCFLILLFIISFGIVLSSFSCHFLYNHFKYCCYRNYFCPKFKIF